MRAAQIRSEGIWQRRHSIDAQVKRSAPQRPSRACENHTPTPVAKSNHQTSSANNRKRSRIIESQSNEGSEQEDGNLLDDDDGALGHDARPRGSKHPRTAARRVVGQYTVQDEDQVDPMDEESDEEYGQADEDEEGPEVDGEDDGEAATSDNDRVSSASLLSILFQSSAAHNRYLWSYQRLEQRGRSQLILGAFTLAC